MIRCSKCNAVPDDNAIVKWKCNSCGKTFQTTNSQLYNLFLKKSANPDKSILKCKNCGGFLDDGNETISWKCSCGNEVTGKLSDFEQKEEQLKMHSNLIKCPECGNEISSKAKRCVHCGKVFVEEKIPTKICNDCGKEMAIDATECPNCGCPVETQTTLAGQVSSVEMQSKKKNINVKKLLPLIIGIVAVFVIGMIVYNVKVVQPKKIEVQNKTTYDEAMELLEKGKYEEANELLQTIAEYKDVDTVLQQIKWESYVYECVNDFKPWLKNPDSFTLYDVSFYLDDEVHGIYASFVGEVDFSYPAIVFNSGAQNGFGGNTTGYELFYYVKDTGYTCVGSCDSLDETEYYNDKGELKDEDDGAMEVLLCKEINGIKENAEQVGDVDLARLKTVLKNDAYSTIKIIE